MTVYTKLFTPSFNRTTRSVSLTEEGRRVYEQVSCLTADFHADASDAAASGIRTIAEASKE
jgi:DNA-binding transcriptional LysR family regulator